MNQYRFILNGYHAIDKAEISIDGITVIAGCNGCGKSTIAKWLYALVNYSNEFNRLVNERLLNILNAELRKMFRIIRNIDLNDANIQRQFRMMSTTAFRQDEYLDYEDVRAHFKSKVELFCSIIEDAERRRKDEIGVWLRKSLGTEDNLFGDFVASYYTTTLEVADKAIAQAYESISSRNFGDLLYFIRRELDIYGDTPKNMSLNEDGMALLSGDRFMSPVGLRNAVYIDTPMALSNHISSDNRIWNRLMEVLTTPAQEVSENALRLVTRIRRIIGGNVVVDRDEFSRDADIRYIRKEDNLNIPIDEAATGLKTFAYMLRLIENGHLGSDSLLLIDEPEAHLHPQWIVEFARILVLLNKELGTKILLASHNPDMIAALQSISRAEGVAEVTKFYQAHRNESDTRYSYESLGNDIDVIFNSFNIALDRIRDYGE